MAGSRNIILLVAKVSFYFLLTSCEKSLDVPLPTNSLTTANAFNNKGTIDGLMTNMYVLFANNLAAPVSLPGEAASLADDAYNPSSTNLQYHQVNNTSPLITNSLISWTGAYRAIFLANTLLEGLPEANAVGLTETNRKQYIAAAKTIRAFGYFQLVRCYGDVPLITSTNADENKLKPRVPKAEVYVLIEKDLREAIQDLPAELGEKYYINNKFIPEAILANVYLTQGKWAEAETATTDIINSNRYQLVNIKDVFLQSSTEAIMAIAYTTVYNSTNSPKTSPLGLLLWPANMVTYENITAALTTDLLNSFEAGDLRKANWVKLSNAANYPDPSFRMFCYKYKFNIASNPVVPAGAEEDTKFIRLAEVYLIRAEARARQNNLSGAAADIERIRTRAGLNNLSVTVTSSQNELITAVLKERRVELFLENGSRWFDLVRTRQANSILSVISYKAANWKPHMILFPLDQATLSANPNLTQTHGY